MGRKRLDLPKNLSTQIWPNGFWDVKFQLKAISATPIVKMFELMRGFRSFLVIFRSGRTFWMI